MKNSTLNNFGLTALVLVAAIFLAAGCATFEIDTPAEMAEVSSRTDRNYDYRAMTPRGVVVGVRVISQGPGEEVPRATSQFWVESVRQRMRTMGGYALLGEEEVQSANGHKGTRMKFGRDQRSSSYLYWVTIFVTDDYVHVIDAGGRKERFEEAQAVIEESLASYVVKR